MISHYNNKTTNQLIVMLKNNRIVNMGFQVKIKVSSNMKVNNNNPNMKLTFWQLLAMITSNLKRQIK